MAYWRLLVEVWKKSSFILIVADGIKALDRAISLAELHVARQGCLVHLKRRKTKEEREALNAIISSAENGEIKPESCPTLLSYLKASKKLWKWLKSNNLIKSFNSLLERRRFGAFHSPWRVLQITRAIVIYYNLLACFLNIVIILNSILAFLTLSEIYPIIFSLDYYNSYQDISIRNGNLNCPNFNIILVNPKGTTKSEEHEGIMKEKGFDRHTASAYLIALKRLGMINDIK
ncbi:hypothetical protein J5U23_00551 [Saccharolobus shibatae B12]|uniref:Transposase n=1 Tax=Saccharolobus shibatae (strain ATCC 51178 / DSM 5389 / JCM 8931 / NBRC 15437 / B12) TaxID=523848 RepID=A0A8F5BM22_SACSH|nr:hypothetical protein J5U23_00551 [Saccharolobus shibatae B12]